MNLNLKLVLFRDFLVVEILQIIAEGSSVGLMLDTPTKYGVTTRNLKTPKKRLEKADDMFVTIADLHPSHRYVLLPMLIPIPTS